MVPDPALPQFITDWGPMGIFLIIILLGQRGVWVWRREYDKAVKDGEWWRDVAAKALNLGEEVVSRRLRDGPD